MSRKVDTEQTKPICGNCICCICTYQGCECSLTDNRIDYDQPGCIDFIPESE